MILAVIDTNILVSALKSRNGLPAQIISLLLNRVIKPCFDNRILEEYYTVLHREKFHFSETEIDWLLGIFESEGYNVVATPIDIEFVDNDDKKFYEVAKYCNAPVITGNAKHFPQEPMIMTCREFITKYYFG